MILQEQDIVKILKERPSKPLVDKGQQQNVELRRHLYGEDLGAYLTQLDGIEPKGLHKLRVKYVQSNKDLMKRLTRPIDKVFSAKGGSSYYNLTSTQDAKLKSLLSNVSDGYSVRSWMQNFWKYHFLDDPNGLIFMEIVKGTDIVKYRRSSRPVCYPTYKSIQDIHEYLPIGSTVEYVFFTTTKAERVDAGYGEADIVYRLVDDEKDVYVKYDEKSSAVYLGDQLPNPFMRVPAMIISDSPNPQMPGNMLPFLDDILDVANSYIRDGSIKLTHKLLHGFPKPWQYAPKCVSCHGDGVKGNDKCESCGGSGFAPVLNVSDMLTIPYPESKDQPIVTPDVAGYTAPPKDYYDMSTADMERLEAAMKYVLWGVQYNISGGQITTDGTKTATEIITSMQPMADRLEEVSNVAERREQFIIDMTALVNITQSYSGCSVNYGTRFLIETPDALRNALSEGIKNKLPFNVLYNMHREYIEAKYDNDPNQLAIELKMMEIEPFPYFTIQEAMEAGVSGEDLKEKVYYASWYARLQPFDRLVKSADELRNSLKDFVSGKEIQQKNALPAPVA